MTDDGGHTFTKTDVRIATLDGHVVDHEHGDTAHQCPNCGTGPYSRRAMTTCAACRRFVCLACLHSTSAGMLCVPCVKALRRRALKEWLWSIF